MAGSQNDQAGQKLPNSGKQTDGVLHQRSKPPIRPLKIVLGGVAFVYIGYLTLCPFGPLRRKSETTALEAAIIEKKRSRN